MTKPEQAEVFEFAKKSTRSKPIISLRLSEPGIDWLDTTAEELGVTRSALMKAAFSYVRKNDKDFATYVKEAQ